MKLNKILDLTTGPKYPELKLYNMYKEKIWNTPKKLETKQVVTRDTKTGTIYGRRTIAQRTL